MNNDKQIVRNFVAAILLQAVKDWANPPTHQMKDEVPVTKNEIGEFLNSEWGESLCHTIGLTSKTMLRKLESKEFYADLLMEQGEQG